MIKNIYVIKMERKVFEELAKGFAKQRETQGKCPAQEMAAPTDGSGEVRVCRYDNVLACEHKGHQVVCEGDTPREKIKTPYLCGYKGKTEAAE